MVKPRPELILLVTEASTLLTLYTLSPTLSTLDSTLDDFVDRKVKSSVRSVQVVQSSVRFQLSAFSNNASLSTLPATQRRVSTLGG